MAQNPNSTTENTRTLSFQKISNIIDLPNMIKLQQDSYNWFLDEGMREIFNEVSPIEDFTGNLVLEFLDYNLEAPTYSVDECRDRDMTYAKPFKVKVRLIIKEAGEIKEVKEQEIFMGDFPSMTEKGTFIVNGAERVIVSQLIRSPGVYFQSQIDPTGKNLYTAQIIPNRGAWLEFETDVNNIIWCRIDKTRKIPVTVLIRALGYETDQDIQELFDEDPILEATLTKDSVKSQDEALVEIYRKLRPGDPPSVDSAKTLLGNLFFDHKRYDMAKVGRYKMNKKLGQHLECKQCGILSRAGNILCPECKSQLEYRITLLPEDINSVVRYLIDLMKGRKESLERPPLYYSVPVLVDDIDHLGNRRVRAVGELLQNQFRVGLLRLERVVKERMTVQDIETVTPQALINIRPVVAAIKEFFGSHQLSQFMDQTNSLAELTHKRRLSAMGPGGLSRERAGFEVRDVHDSHYGRICPIETPEGPNIGLVVYLATYARVNEFGFIMSPYRRVKDGHVSQEVDYLTADEEDQYVVAQANTILDQNNNIINDRVVARAAKDETRMVRREEVSYMDVSPKQVVSVATALIPFLEHDDANRALMGANMQRQAVPLIKPQAPLIGTGVEHRAAKDSGALIVSKYSGVVDSVTSQSIVLKLLSKEDMEVLTLADGNQMVCPMCDHRWDKKDVSKKSHNIECPKCRIFRNKNGVFYKEELAKFKRSNNGTCINQRPVVRTGDMVKAGDIIADGGSSVNGKLALGRNIVVAFMAWEGYNYEDAILISEDLVKDDVFTSIHIEEYECDARDTKLGAEEITRDIPNVGEDALKDLDEQGIIRIGADVRAEDILVGKVTPKGETELTAEERLLRAIFGEKARDVRDTSLKVPHGEKGKIIDTKVFSRENGDELSPGVNKLVRVYVAQKRKILQGDKMAGRHGNKGVIAKVLPVEDMPYLPDGTPVQIVLNPLGVPSRMNIGQILETHLGWAAQELGLDFECPVFDSASEQDISEYMKMAHLKRDLERQGIELTREDMEMLVGYDTLQQRIIKFFRERDIFVSLASVIELAKHKELEGEIRKILESNNTPFNKNEVKEMIKDKDLKEIAEYIFDKRSISYDEKLIQDFTDYVAHYKNLKESGKSILFDGRTGEPFDSPIMVGVIYMMKLAHLVDDKIHARSTGPYSLITQQPLGGKAQFGGQRFGEMEVWALEAYGAAHTLQELLTVKSDDVVGRVKTYEAIVKGENVMEPGIPESFKVLIKEMQSLCLDVKILSGVEEGNPREIDLKGIEVDDVRATARELGLELGEEALKLTAGPKS
jgi:DNA-directed RNA polymerase subunit beta